MSRFSVVLTLTGLLAAPVVAAQTPLVPTPAPPMTSPLPLAPTAMPAMQGRQTPPTPPAVPATAPAQRPTTPPAPPAQPSPKVTNTMLPPGTMSLDPVQQVNVRVELAIAETQGSGPSTKKTVTVLTSGMNRGSVRSTLRTPGITMVLNVDARPTLLKDGKIMLYLNFQYVPEHVASAEIATAELNEEMAVILTDGKPLLVSQSADAKGDRKVTVEVTATVVK